MYRNASGAGAPTDGVIHPSIGGEGGTTLPPSVTFNMLIRDFKRYDKTDSTTNPGFDNVGGEIGVVADALGDDDKPVYMKNTRTTTFGKTYFDQWYRDVPGTNITVSYPLTLTLTTDGKYEYDSEKTGTSDITANGTPRRVFFPIDDGSPYATAFGNQGKKHNQCFTGELHAMFTYKGEQGTLRFRGDDDVYVYVDKQLVIDLGGVHSAQGKELDVGSLNLVAGQDYPLDVFYAERQGATGDLLVTTVLELRPAIK